MSLGMEFAKAALRYASIGNTAHFLTARSHSMRGAKNLKQGGIYPERSRTDQPTLCLRRRYKARAAANRPIASPIHTPIAPNPSGKPITYPTGKAKIQ